LRHDSTNGGFNLVSGWGRQPEMMSMPFRCVLDLSAHCSSALPQQWCRFFVWGAEAVLWKRFVKQEQLQQMW